MRLETCSKQFMKRSNLSLRTRSKACLHFLARLRAVSNSSAVSSERILTFSSLPQTNTTLILPLLLLLVSNAFSSTILVSETVYQLPFEQHPLPTPTDDTSRLICSRTTPPSTKCYHPRLQFKLLF